MTQVLRQKLIDTALAMNASGLNKGASGNLSVRYGDGFLITLHCIPTISISEDPAFGEILTFQLNQPKLVLAGLSRQKIPGEVTFHYSILLRTWRIHLT